MMRFSPGIRFICFFALAAILVSCVAMVQNMGAVVYVGCAVFIPLIALADLYFSRSLIKQVHVVFPHMVRLSRNRETQLSFLVNKTSNRIKKIQIGLAFPDDQFSAQYEQSIALSRAKTRVNWPVTGKKQGAYPLETCHVQIPSPLKLWDIKTDIKITCELNVYPDMSTERKNLAALFTASEYGIHFKKSIGKGREFEHLREYLPGDIYEDIHWKATARRGVPVTKIFQMEKTQDIYVMLDASRLSARNAAVFTGQNPDNSSQTILEKYITTTLSMGLAAHRQGDNFGLGVFTDKVDHFLKASSKKSHFNLCRDALYTLEPKKVTPDFNEWITFVGNKIRKRSLLIVLTSLDDPAIAENLLDHIHILSRRHLVMVNMLQPASARPLFSSDKIQSTDQIYDHLGGHLQWHFLTGFEKSLGRMGIGFKRHSLSRLTFDLISRYIEIKQRQAI